MKISGREALRAKMLALPAAARAEVRKALQQNGEEMVATARALAPVDEGDLRDSIVTREGRDELQQVVTAGGPKTTRRVRSGTTATYDYAPKIEFEEQPFFFPAYRSLRKRFRGRLSRALTAAAKKVMSGGGSS